MPTWIRNFFEDLYFRKWLITLAWSGGVTLVIFVVGALGSSSASRAAAAAVAVALGFVAGVATVAGIPGLPPGERWQWSAWVTIGSLLLLFVEDARGGPAVLRFVVMAGVVTAIEWFLLLDSSLARDWAERWPNWRQQAVYFGGGLAAVVFLLVAEIRTAAKPYWRGLVGFAIAAIVAVPITADGWSENVARAFAGLAMALLLCLLLALVQREVPLGRTVATTASLAFGSLLVFMWGWRGDDHWLLHGDMITLLLFASWASSLIPLPRNTPWISLALATALAAAPAIGAYLVSRQPVE